MIRLKLKTAPTTEPVTLVEAKAQLRVDITADDTLIGSLITAARDYVEQTCRIAMVSQTWYAYLDQFPASRGFIYLPKCPLSSVSAITYTDNNGATQTWTSSEYVVDGQTSSPGRVSLAYNKTWPQTRPQANAVRVEFIAGFGAAAAVPQALKQAMLLMIGHWYENREAVANVGSTVPLSAKALLSSYRIVEAPVYLEDA